MLLESAMPHAPATFLIADDHAIFRQGLRAVLGRLDPEARVIETESFEAAMALTGTHPELQLIVADLRMPDHDGFTGMRALRKSWPSTPILALSASEQADDVFLALEAGASGYVSKSTSTGRLIEVMQLVMLGGIYVPRDLLDGQRAPAPHPGAALTPRQREILALVVEGCSNKEIARRIAIREGTVKAHLAAIMRHFGVNNRVKLLLEVSRQEAGGAARSSSAVSTA